MKRSRTDSELSIDAQEFVWEQPGLTEAHRHVLPVVRRWLHDAGCVKVLDLGCGNGAVAQELLRERFTVVGADASRSGLSIAEQHCPQVEFVQADIDKPLPRDLRGEFDAVIAIEVIEHLPLPRMLLRRAREALVGGGRLILTTPYHGYWKNLALALTNRFDTHWHPLRDHGHIKFFSMATLTSLLEEEKFSVSRVSRVGRVPALARSMICEALME